MVISGITTFWCSPFILPKACINKINSLCSTFLWKGDIDSRNSARVAWGTITLTKEYGDLGVKDLQTWTKHALCAQSGCSSSSMTRFWVCWFKEVILKGSIPNCRTTKPNQSYSWLANKILKMKSVVYPLIRLIAYVCHKVLRAKVLVQQLEPSGYLHDFLHASNSRLGIPLNVTVASLYRIKNVVSSTYKNGTSTPTAFIPNNSQP